MRTSESTKAIFEAVSALGVAISNPTKGGRANTGSYGYTYVELDAILSEVRPLLSAAGLAVIQETATTDTGHPAVTSRLVHSSGEWVEVGPLAMPAKSDAQSYGSALTYARRYSLMALLSIAGEDDDGKQASGAGTGHPSRSSSEGEGKGQPGPAVADGEAAAAPPSSDKPTVCVHPIDVRREVASGRIRCMACRTLVD